MYHAGNVEHPSGRSRVVYIRTRVRTYVQRVVHKSATSDVRGISSAEKADFRRGGPFVFDHRRRVADGRDVRPGRGGLRASRHGAAVYTCNVRRVIVVARARPSVARGFSR